MCKLVCQLNKVIRCKQYPLPTITEILCKHSGYMFFAKLDISMQYYTFELYDESQDLCTIVTPFGKYKYLRLPMGLKCSPDIAQSVMENVLCGIKDIECYIDDNGVLSYCPSGKPDKAAQLTLLQSGRSRVSKNGAVCGG